MSGRRRPRTGRSVRSNGKISKVIAFTPSKMDAERRFAETKPFVFKAWLARFSDPRTRNIDRLGMIRVIPDIDFRSPAERVSAIRTILMPLADKLAEDSENPRSRVIGEYFADGADIGKLRVTAWLVLAERFFSAKGCQWLPAFMQCEGFVDDMLGFFRKEKLAQGERSNLRALSIREVPASAYSAESRLAYEAKCQERCKLRKRAEAALAGMTEFVKEFFISAWNYAKCVEFIDISTEGRRKSAQIHEEVSVDRQFELFAALIHINPKWLKELPWDEKTFGHVAYHVREEARQATVSDAAAADSESGIVSPLTEAARVLIQIAYDQGWSKRHGVLSDLTS